VIAYDVKCTRKTKNAVRARETRRASTLYEKERKRGASRENANRVNLAGFARRELYAVNEVPQPHEPVAFGFLNAKPCPITLDT
jgi:hypothetical protein